MKSFMDLLKDELISSKTIGNMTFESVIWALLLSVFAGIMIYMIYKFSHSGVMFINHFAITLVGLTMVTTLIILTITSNLLLSLGMVGALSIVRFRTAIKEPMDMIYMFWSIATGVAIGAGFFMLAGVGLVFIGLVLFLLSKYSSSSELYILVLRAKVEREVIEEHFKKHMKSYKYRAETHLGESVEFTYELRGKKTDALMNSLKENDIKDMSLVSYNTNTLL